MNRRPESRKDWATIAAVLLALVGGSVAAKEILLSGAAVSATARASTNVLININRQRALHNLPPLKLDPKLAGVAIQHSSDMMKNQYFAHDGPDGIFSKRVWAAVPGRSMIAENLALEDIRHMTVVYDWMHSPPHRENVLRADAKRLGIGIVVGTYHGQADTALVTADFSS